jgi:hypothetical protein
MSDFSVTWDLVRGRFLGSLEGLSDAQLNWRLHPKSLTLGEAAIHVAGVEMFFASQLQEDSLYGLDARVAQASTQGVVNDLEFPFGDEEINGELVQQILDRAAAYLRPLMEDPDAWRSRSIVSALGPVIDGTGAFARLAYHPAYHHAQVYLISTSPNFPVS